EDLTPKRAGGDEDKDDEDDEDDDLAADADAELNDDDEPEQADDDSGTAQDHVVDAEPSKRKPLRRSTRSKQADL
ncbi:MAG: hypothetical protein WKF51_06085, partial [Geodermatophilaceae bacterium]